MPLEITINIAIEHEYESSDLKAKLQFILFENETLISTFNEIAVENNQVINEEIIDYLNKRIKDFKEDHPKLTEMYFYEYLMPEKIIQLMYFFQFLLVFQLQLVLQV